MLTDLEVRLAETGGCVVAGALPSVEVRARTEPGGNDGAEAPQCILEVSDNGVRFDPKYVDRIFAPFQRLHGRSAYEGMGLAVCRRIAERHGGEITARSRPGEGTPFVVTLPLRRGSATAPLETS